MSDFIALPWHCSPQSHWQWCCHYEDRTRCPGPDPCGHIQWGRTCRYVLSAEASIRIGGHWLWLMHAVQKTLQLQNVKNKKLMQEKKDKTRWGEVYQLTPITQLCLQLVLISSKWVKNEIRAKKRKPYHEAVWEKWQLHIIFIFISCIISQSHLAPCSCIHSGKTLKKNTGPWSRMTQPCQHHAQNRMRFFPLQRSSAILCPLVPALIFVLWESHARCEIRPWIMWFLQASPR